MSPSNLAPCLLAFVALSLPVRAQVTPAQAEAVMRQSGLWQQMDAAAPQLRMTIETALQDRVTGVAPELRRQLAPRIEQQITAPALRQRVLVQLARTLRADDLPAYEAWFNGAAGRRVVALEQQAEADAASPGVSPDLALKAWSDASLPRQDVLDQVVERSRAADLQVALVNAVTPALRRLKADLEPGYERRAEDAPHPLLAPRPGDLPRQMHLTMRMEYALRFQALTDEDLAAWLRFLQTPAGERLTGAVLLASVAVPLDTIADLGRGPP